MAPVRFIDRPSPFNTKAGKTLPIFAITPAYICLLYTSRCV